MAGVPPIGELDPEQCYLGWDMVLTTSTTREAIADVFIFVEDNCKLTIEPVAIQESRAEAAGPGLQKPAAKAPSWGRRSYDSAEAASSLRVPAAKLDQFVNLVGELVTVQARLGEIATRREDIEMLAVSEEVERLTSALRENSMSIRMLPIRGTFERFRRLVYDLARDLHKEVDLVTEGVDTELDKTVIDQLNDPLMHLIRNSIDHGVDREIHVAAGTARSSFVSTGALAPACSSSVADDQSADSVQGMRQRAVRKGAMFVHFFVQHLAPQPKNILTMF